MMVFEQAIENANTMFLFDLRSQHKMQEMADAAEPNSWDRALIRLSHAAFLYYNARDADDDNMLRPIAQATEILEQVKRYREDRVLYTMALRLEARKRVKRSMS